jgi:FkbM family methyltransferase
MNRRVWVKRAIMALIAGILMLDVIVLAVPGEYHVVLSAAVQGTANQCSLGQALREVWIAKSPREFESRISLLRSEEGLDLWNTPLGPIWDVHKDTTLPFLLWEQVRDIYEPGGHEVRKGDIVLDCGANIGMFTRTALAGGASLVVAVEPAPQTIAAFRRNFDKELREGRVILYPKGVWDHDTEMGLFTTDALQVNNSVVMPRGAGTPTIRVPLTTIDKMVDELKLTRVDFIKMDIEGAEKPAIRGAQNTIRRFHPKMSLSTEHLDDDFEAIPALVHSIEPSYTSTPCDCVERGGRLRSLVSAFVSAR